MSFRLNYTSNAYSVISKQRGNNALLTSTNAMPQQFYPTSNDSVLSMGRQYYKNTNTTNTLTFPKKKNCYNYIQSSQRIEQIRNAAIGKSSLASSSEPISFRSNEHESRNTALRRCRGGGCVAPKKKTSYYL